jgi:hypothetical protein
LFAVRLNFKEKNVWTAQPPIAMLFDTIQQNESLHINSMIEEGELSKMATHKNFL